LSAESVRLVLWLRAECELLHLKFLLLLLLPLLLLPLQSSLSCLV
jgi:hypothetical protein